MGFLQLADQIANIFLGLYPFISIVLLWKIYRNVKKINKGEKK